MLPINIIKANLRCFARAQTVKCEQNADSTSGAAFSMILRNGVTQPSPQPTPRFPETTSAVISKIAWQENSHGGDLAVFAAAYRRLTEIDMIFVLALRRQRHAGYKWYGN